MEGEARDGPRIVGHLWAIYERDDGRNGARARQMAARETVSRLTKPLSCAASPRLMRDSRSSFVISRSRVQLPPPAPEFSPVSSDVDQPEVGGRRQSRRPRGQQDLPALHAVIPLPPSKLTEAPVM